MDWLICLAIVAAFVLIPARRKGSLRYGWGKVYVLRDIQNPELIKIGRTSRSAKIRMKEVSVTMTGGVALELLYWIETPYYATVEIIAHRKIRRRRYRSERGTEWFKADAATAIRAVELAVRDVRRSARRQRKWSAQADRTVTSWRKN